MKKKSTLSGAQSEEVFLKQLEEAYPDWSQ